MLNKSKFSPKLSKQEISVIHEYDSDQNLTSNIITSIPTLPLSKTALDDPQNPEKLDLYSSFKEAAEQMDV